MDSLLTVVRTTRSAPQQIKALLALSDNFRKTDSTQAYSYARQALRLANQRVDTMRTVALLALGIAYHAQGHHQRAMAYLQQGLKIAQRRGRLRDIALSYQRISTVHQRQSHFAETVAALQQELRLRLQFHDTARMVAVYNNLGNIHYRHGDYPTGLRYYLQALHLAEVARQQSKIAFITVNLANLYQEQDDTAQALQYMHRAVAMHHTLHDTAALSIDYFVLADFYVDNGQPQPALRYVTKSLALSASLKQRADVLDRARAYNIMGKVRAAQGKHTLALRSFQQAEAVFSQRNETRNLMVTLLSEAESYQALRQPEAARRAVQQALVLAQKHRSKADLQEVFKVLASLSAANNDFAAAYAYKQRYETLHDSLFNEQKAQQLSGLQASYDLRNKEAQIALLRHNASLMESETHLQRYLGLALGGALLLATLLGASWYRRYQFQRAANHQLQLQDQAIAATNSRLQKSLGEKEVLLKEIHHRVKNNLQIIASMFALQAFEQPNNPVLTEALQEGQNRIQAIALIHELLYRSDDLARIDVGQFLRQLATYLAQAFAPQSAAVTLSLQADGIQLNTSTSVPLALIINELLSNAYQHAFTDGHPGHILLQITPPAAADQPYTLLVADNGVGLPDGFVPEAASSLGLRLINNLAQQLQGHCAVEDVAVGASFRVTFHEIEESAATP